MIARLQAKITVNNNNQLIENIVLT